MSRHDIAAIWVAFFSRCQRYRCGQDSHIVSFMHQAGIAHDIITDEHLHREGVAALAPYKCIVSGTHPEYYSSAMLLGLREFTRTGGRLLYTGANGY